MSHFDFDFDTIQIPDWDLPYVGGGGVLSKWCQSVMTNSKQCLVREGAGVYCLFVYISSNDHRHEPVISKCNEKFKTMFNNE